MSYILDALQRAALERERASGSVPGLQTRSIAAEPAANPASALMRRRWPWLALIIGLAVAVAGVVFWPTAPVTAPSPVPPTTSAPVAAPPPVAAAPAAAVPAPAPAPVAASPVLPEPSRLNPPGPVAAAESTAVSKPQATAQPAAPPVTAPAAPSPPAPTPTPEKSSTPAAPTAKANLPLLKDLPETIRAQIPPLAISGVVYSDNPAQRLILLNGQVVTEGSRINGDLVLDEIHPRSSDFTFRGTRFKLSH